MQSSTRPYYLVIETPQGKRSQRLGEKPYWTIGRSRDNDIVIADRSISRRHALLQATATGEFNLVDLGSLNGTWVNDRRISVEVSLKNGDRIGFGNCYGEFYAPSVREKDSQGTSEAGVAEAEEEIATALLRQQQLVSVVVVELREFRMLAPKMESEVLSQLMDQWFGQVGKLFSEAENWGNKALGDKIMALWSHREEEVKGGKTSTGQQLLKILEVVRAVNQLTMKLSQKYQSSLEFPLRVGVGMNTGLAMVGNLGSKSLPDHRAMGDTVNLAFYLKSAMKEMGADLLMGEGSYRHLIEFETVKELLTPYQVKSERNKEMEMLVYGTTWKKLEGWLGQSLMPSNQADISRKLTIDTSRTGLSPQGKDKIDN